MRSFGRVLVGGVVALIALFVGLRVIGWALHVLVGTIAFAFNIAIFVAVLWALAWSWRKIRGKSKRGAGTPALEKGLDWAFIRGRMSKDEYLHRKAMSRMK
jgi:hypothetical protein